MRRRVSKTALLIAAALSVFWASLGGPILIHFYNYDFLCYYIGGTLVRQGHFADLYSPAAQMQVQRIAAPGVTEPRPFVRPPWFAFALAPLTYLSLVHAYAVWIAGLLVTLLATWAWATVRFGESGLLLAVLFLPANLGICFGQDSAMMLAVFCVSYVLLTREKSFASGLVLGLGLMKFHLLLMFPVWMVLQKRWRMLAGFAATGAAFLVASLLVIGPSGLAAYVDILLHGQTELIGHSPETMANIYSVPANFGAYFGKDWKVLDAPLAVLVIGIALCGLRRATAWRAIAIAGTASLLISPHAFGYDAAMLLLPVWLVIENATRKISRYAALILAAPVTFFFTLANPPLECIPALALLAFLIAMVTDRSPAACALTPGAKPVPHEGREIPRLAEAHPLV
jgi:Glycosyltransferase family 87